MDVARIDLWAANGSGPLHRASTTAKAVFLLLVVTAAVAAKNPYPLMAGYALILATAAFARLRWTALAALSTTALFFAVIYAVSLRGGWRLYALVVFKAITPSLAVLTLVASTPYPMIFSFISAALPEALAAGLFMTYRTLFILLDMMDGFAAAIRIRGGFSPGSLYKNGSNISRGLAMLLVRAIERSSRIYAVMSVRGYNGSMAERGSFGLKRDDWLPLCVGIMALLLVAVWK
jgi:energy-coupling factor transporter transmembrane protein EcfT